MKRVAIFVEGESEKVFIFNLLLKLFDPSEIMIECMKMYTDDNFQEDTNKHSSPNPKFDFLIINAGSDTKVVSAIYRSSNLMQGYGYTSVIGLRDLYCQDYHKRSPNVIDQAVGDKIIKSAQDTINSLGLGTSINLFFSVMEIEAWYFGFSAALGRLGYTTANINSILGIDLLIIDPEKEFYKPKAELEKIHSRIKSTPFREVRFAHAISNEVTLPEINSVIGSSKLSHFKFFFEYLKSL